MESVAPAHRAPPMSSALIAQSSSAIRPRIVVIRRNDQGSFGFSVLGGIEDDLLPSIKLRQDMSVVTFV